MKKVFFFLGVLCTSWAVPAQKLPGDTAAWNVQMEEVLVFSTRAGSRTPVAFSQVGSSEINQNNAAANLPYVLSLTPSLVAVSENGTPVGNTSLRIRGSSSSRINVTLNGIPMNDAESQEVFWVNLPALSYSLRNVQVQRGVGTSTNGPASFGGALNLQSLGNSVEGYGMASTGIGSYHTYESSLAFGTGLMKSGLSMDFRYSKVLSDGYVRNGKVNHQSLFTSFSYRSAKSLLRFHYILGDQHTGITWEGSSPSMIEQDRRYNPAGIYYDDAGNIRYYDNETDNYRQNLFQLLYSREMGLHWTLNGNLGYTHGYGYYENYKYDRKFSKYGLPAQIIGEESYLSSDFISRQIMDNDFYAATLAARYLSEKLTLNLGGMYSDHQGDHYGILPWVKYNENVETDYQWYFNVGKKRDLNYFTKAEWRFSSDWSLFGDLQYRYVSYDMEGADNDLADLSQDHQWHFFNPKGGIFFRPDARNEAWFSVAVSHREPTRSDLKDAIKYGGTHEVLPERMTDFEAGYRYIAEKATFVINGYLMLYKDQLTATGKLSNTGYALMENVKDSYRLGVEMTGGIKPLSWLSLDANLTLSRNRIQDYTGWIDQYDNPDDWNMVSQIPVYKKSSTLSFSPDVIAAGILTVNPVKPLSLALTAKYVGSQYYDNLASPENKIPSYLVGNFQATYTRKCKNSSSIEFQFLVNNLFNNDYIANAWAYTARFADGSPENTDRGFFVQAPRNIMSRITFRF